MMGTKIGEERDGKQLYLSAPFYQAGRVMRAVVELEVETHEGTLFDGEVQGNVVYIDKGFGWLPDAALLDEMVELYDFAPGRDRTFEGQLAKAMGR